MEQLEIDSMYMSRCLELAEKGMRNVVPNPMVGAVVVHNNTIIGEGFHKEFGQDHAERVAINSVVDKSLLSQSTLYVSLEPCSHFGKTPPCTDLIKETGIKRVVIATKDPNPKVLGRGTDVLTKSGCEVAIGVLEKEARELNRRFFVYHIKKRPYIILKWAQTLDGFIDCVRKPNQPIEPVWITNDLAKTLVHHWRSEEQAIMIGTNTVDKDNPRLDVRYWSGTSPLRLVIDRILRLPTSMNVYDGSIPTLVFIGNNSTASGRKASYASIPNLEIITVDFAKGVETQICKELFEREILSLIIEGGTLLLSSFIQRNLWDEARIFVGNKFFGEGIKAPVFSGMQYSYDQIGDSKLFTYRNRVSGG